MYCDACISTHSRDCDLINQFCAHRKNTGFSDDAAATLRGELSKFAAFVLTHGCRSLLEVEGDDIETYLNAWASKGKRGSVSGRKRSQLRFFYRWLLRNNRIKRDPTASTRCQLSFPF
jgi:site-specific recombinase XerD